MSGPEQPRTPTTATLTGYSLALNYLPALFLGAGALAVWWAGGWSGRLLVGLFWIYLLPPLLGRAVLVALGRPQGRDVRQNERAYTVGWFLAQLQVPFNRLPALEELLRLVPGLYSAWLNLWGGRVSPFAYWGPGARILDRCLVRVERRAVIGTGVLLSGHLGLVAEDGEFAVDIAPVTVEEGAIVGAAAALGPGARVSAGEMVPSGRSIPPFTVWQGGRKVRESEVAA